MIAKLEEIIVKLDADGGHAPAQQLGRVSSYVDDVPGQCEVCRSFDQAPHVPVAGT